jgi:hypothetical protein
MSKKDQAFVLFDQGKRPGDQDVKNLGLKPKTTYNYFQEWKKLCGEIESPVGDDRQGKSSSQPTTKGIKSAVVKFQTHVITCEYTPIMEMAREAATNEWNWDPDIRFEDFIDTILYHFFKDRGITLQGYIVDEEAEAK